MKLVIIIAIALGSAFLLKPDLFADLPLPQNAEWEQRQIDGYIKRCVKTVGQKISKQIPARMGLKKSQFRALVYNPKFQSSFCACQGEIVRFTGLIPSSYFPKKYKVQRLRSIASEMSQHMQTDEGQSQVQFCFREAWNKAAFSY